MEWKTSNLFGVQWKWTTTSIFPFIYSETVIYLETKKMDMKNQHLFIWAFEQQPMFIYLSEQDKTWTKTFIMERRMVNSKNTFIVVI